MEKNQKIRIRLNAFDSNAIDHSARQIVETVKQTGAMVSGPVLLPTRIERHTLLRSPHKHKKARDQFEIRTHKRLLDILSPSDKTIDSMMKLNLASGVEAKIEVMN